MWWGLVFVAGVVSASIARYLRARWRLRRSRHDLPQGRRYTYTQGTYGDYDWSKASAGARRARSMSKTGRRYHSAPRDGSPAAHDIVAFTNRRSS